MMQTSGRMRRKNKSKEDANQGDVPLSLNGLWNYILLLSFKITNGYEIDADK